MRVIAESSPIIYFNQSTRNLQSILKYTFENIPNLLEFLINIITNEYFPNQTLLFGRDEYILGH